MPYLSKTFYLQSPFMLFVSKALLKATPSKLLIAFRLKFSNLNSQILTHKFKFTKTLFLNSQNTLTISLHQAHIKSKKRQNAPQ